MGLAQVVLEHNPIARYDGIPDLCQLPILRFFPIFSILCYGIIVANVSRASVVSKSVAHNFHDVWTNSSHLNVAGIFAAQYLKQLYKWLNEASAFILFRQQFHIPSTDERGILYLVLERRRPSSRCCGSYPRISSS